MIYNIYDIKGALEGWHVAHMSHVVHVLAGTV